MKIILLLLLVSLSFISPEVMSQDSEPYFCTKALDDMPIQQSGRIKPLYVHANESIKYLMGKKKIKSYGAVEIFCLLSVQSLSLKNSLNFKARIDHIKLREYLGLNDQNKTMLFSTLLEKKDELIIELRKAKEHSSYYKSLNEILNRVALYEDIINGNNWTLPSFESGGTTWQPLNKYLTEEKLTSMPAGTTISTIFTSIREKFKKQSHSEFYLELRMVKMRLPVIALLLTILALAAVVLSTNLKYTLIFSVLTVLTQITYITFRVLISGRAPITNMYETVLFSGLAALIISLIVGHLKKEKQYITVGLIYNFLTLMMILFSGSMLSSSISPLVPVLRDNFWLSTHVTSIIMSYGALALSWVLANMILIKAATKGVSKKELKSASDQIYACIICGIILLANGIILGGVWADYSWGRFWGWDPKETWSLIVLCIYMAILHGKYTSWIPHKRFIPLVACAFLSVMMAWFGVNYILASGLHSYGFSEGGALFLGVFFLTQIALVIITTPKLLKEVV
ncbi:MAG: cytochrome c biogenesis protein CcsA [Bacteriovoracaceae bacterium]|jgi:cytochrome c-type biogenesis protein CcsB|nr:cytochrome c biogenesis protein CcsA [Bacteriovoracaceae bacterium]